MSIKFLDGSEVDPIYSAQINCLINQSVLATHYFTEDELEEYADSVDKAHLIGENK
jgi:hypothetical protein